MPRTLPLILAATLVAAPAFAQEARPQPESTTALAERQSVTAREFMVAAAHPLATQAGYDVLAAGGSAADAAVAVQMALNVVEPQSSGIGGGAFAVYWDAALGELTTFDGRETAPAAATPEYWLGPDGTPREFWDALVGGRSVGVPGTLKLMERAPRRLRPPALGRALRARRSRSPRTASRSPSASPPRSSRRTTTRSTTSPPPARSTSTRTAPRSSRARSCATPTSPAPSGSSPPRAASPSTKAPSPATSSPPSAPRPIPACSPSRTSPATR